MCDFFLCGYSKLCVYVDKEELKDAIGYEIRLIDHQTLERMWVNFKVKVAECIDKCCNYFRDVIFKTKLQ